MYFIRINLDDDRFNPREEYISQAVTLVDKSGNKEFHMEVGKHVFSFNFELPVRLPTSFWHNMCKINYSVQAKIDIQG